jgi:hypothetical protein
LRTVELFRAIEACVIFGSDGDVIRDRTIWFAMGLACWPYVALTTGVRLTVFSDKTGEPAMVIKKERSFVCFVLCAAMMLFWEGQARAQQESGAPLQQWPGGPSQNRPSQNRSVQQPMSSMQQSMPQNTMGSGVGSSMGSGSMPQNSVQQQQQNLVTLAQQQQNATLLMALQQQLLAQRQQQNDTGQATPPRPRRIKVAVEQDSDASPAVARTQDRESEDREQAASARLQMARDLAADADVAQIRGENSRATSLREKSNTRLASIVNKYSETSAADEAKSLLKKR